MWRESDAISVYIRDLLVLVTPPRGTGAGDPPSQVNPPLGQGHVTLALSDPSVPYMCVCLCVVLCFGRQVPHVRNRSRARITLRGSGLDHCTPRLVQYGAQTAA